MTSLSEQRKKVEISIAALADRKEKINHATLSFTSKYDDLMTEVKKTLDLIENQRAELEKFVTTSMKKMDEMSHLTSDLDSKMSAIDDLLGVLKSFD